MEPIKKWSKSRTNMVAMLSLLLTILQASESLMSPEVFTLTQSVLMAFVVFFRSNPRVQ